MTTLRSLKTEVTKLKNRQKARRLPHRLTTSESRDALERILTNIENRVAKAIAEDKAPTTYPVAANDPLKVFLDRELARLDAEEGRIPQ